MNQINDPKQTLNASTGLTLRLVAAGSALLIALAVSACGQQDAPEGPSGMAEKGMEKAKQTGKEAMQGAKKAGKDAMQGAKKATDKAPVGGKSAGKQGAAGQSSESMENPNRPTD
ncbi:MAG: hypothetical protein ACR2KU_00425 [Gammaproteobacteria bacterium]